MAARPVVWGSRRGKQPEVWHKMPPFPPTCSPCAPGFQGHLYSRKARPSSRATKRGVAKQRETGTSEGGTAALTLSLDRWAPVPVP